MWLLFLSCAISEPGPAPAGTPAADALVEVRSVEQQAQDVAELADRLTAMTDEARRRVAAGESTREEEAAMMISIMDEIEEKNTALQDMVRRLEVRAHEQAGDVSWPPERIERK
jgi:hypothetical protein